MAFGEKVKIINSYVPEKVKVFIEKNLIEELKYFQKKYVYEVKILSNDKFLIPEYKIELLNKSKKIINTVENIHLIDQANQFKKSSIKKKKAQENDQGTVNSKDKTKKTKIKKKVRTLWVRRKKRS